MAKNDKKISIPIVILLLIVFFPAAIIYVIVKLGGAHGTSEEIGDNIKIIKERSNSSSKYDDLKKLQDLKKSGAISTKEYEQEKQKLLSK